MKYSVQYELDVPPTPVTVEIVCKDIVEANQVYNDRKTNSNLKNIQLLETKEDIDLEEK